MISRGAERRSWAVAPRIWTVTAHVPVIGGALAPIRTEVERPVVLALLAAGAIAVVWVRRPAHVGRRPAGLRRRPGGSRSGRRAAQGRHRVRGRRRAVTLLVTAGIVLTGLGAGQSVVAPSAQVAFGAFISRAHTIATAELLSSSLGSPTAGCVSRAARVTLAWTSPSDKRTSIVAERRRGTGAWGSIATTPAAVTVYTDADPALAFASTYSYRLRHANGTWVGAHSNERSVNTLTAATCL